jgi:hypothetical protein
MRMNQYLPSAIVDENSPNESKQSVTMNFILILLFANESARYRKYVIVVR